MRDIVFSFTYWFIQKADVFFDLNPIQGTDGEQSVTVDSVVPEDDGWRI